MKDLDYYNTHNVYLTFAQTILDFCIKNKNFDNFLFYLELKLDCIEELE